MPVGESCKTCEKACIAKVKHSTTQWVSRASTEISRRKIIDLSFVLLRFSQFIIPSASQIKSLEKGIINDREGISSYIYIYIYIVSRQDIHIHIAIIYILYILYICVLYIDIIYGHIPKPQCPHFPELLGGVLLIILEYFEAFYFALCNK